MRVGLMLTIDILSTELNDIIRRKQHRMSCIRFALCYIGSTGNINGIIFIIRIYPGSFNITSIFVYCESISRKYCSFGINPSSVFPFLDYPV